MGRLKQLLPLGDRLVIQVVIETALSRVDAVHVVIGHRADEVEAALAPYPVQSVRNPNYELGMTSSIQCGIAAAAGAAAFLLFLGDQPGVSECTIERLLRAREVSAKGLVVPTFDGRRGHPVLIDGNYTPEILSMAKQSPFNTFTRGHGADAEEVAVASSRILDDMDTPVDYERELTLHRYGGEG